MKDILPLISPSAFFALEKDSTVLIDASFGRQNFENLHLRGALHVDLNIDLSDIKDDFAKGGRHPLPSPEAFGGLLSRLGITPETHVVVYDDKNGANAAARFWWMMRAIGHQKIQVLDGGKDAALAAGFPGESGPVRLGDLDQYPIQSWSLPIADIDEVEMFAQADSHLVIDVRENYRYRGESEPIDLVAGHIPGAVNLPYFANLDENGFFNAPNKLQRMYGDLIGDRESQNIIVHCGSGVTACHTILALAHAGMDIPKLYVGSWSEWSRNGKAIGRE